MSELSAKPISAVAMFVASMGNAIGSVITIIAAAGTAANAVENHRQPTEAALRKLGLEGVRFKQYY